MNREIKIGLTVIGAIVLIYLSIAWIKRVHLFAPEERSLQLNFAHVAGLLEGDPVYVRGYLSGRVLSIQPESKQVKVIISLDNRIQLFEDAHAEIQLKELMSGKQVSLFSGEKTQAFDISQAIPGKASLDFSSGFSTLTEIASGLSPQRIDRMLNQLDTIAYSASALLKAIDPSTISRIIHRIDYSLQDLQGFTADLRQHQLIEKVDTTLLRTNQLLTTADHSFQKLNELSEELNVTQVDSVMQNLLRLSHQGEVLLGDLQEVLQQLKQRESLAGRLLYDPNFSNQIDSTLNLFDQVLKQIRTEKLYISLGKNKGKEGGK